METTCREPRHADNCGELTAVVVGEGLVASCPLPATGSVGIGRGESAEVRIDHPSVSRDHAVLDIADRITVVDLGSTNGTRVRGAWLPPNVPAALEIGEPVELGSVTFVIQRRPVVLAPAGDRPHHELRRIAASDVCVLITGETGAGKEVLAQRLHDLSDRRDGPFLRLNCAALAGSLFESELFGYERGAFTSAEQAKPGLLETAAGGTVLLDEIGDLPPPLQAKLLRVIEARQVLRLGGLAPRPINVRFLAATHRDLVAEVARGSFRQDLYYRLDGISLHVPPLRERGAEIEELAARLLADAAARSGLATSPAISAAARDALVRYSWPGNVRELRNVMERALLLGAGRAIRPEHLSMRAGAGAGATPGLADGAGERDRIVEALHRSGWNQTTAAALLGVSRHTLVSRIVALGIPRPRKRRTIGPI